MPLIDEPRIPSHVLLLSVLRDPPARTCKRAEGWPESPSKRQSQPDLALKVRTCSLNFAAILVIVSTAVLCSRSSSDLDR